MRPLRQAVIIPSYACNLSCSHCEYARDRGSVAGALAEDDLQKIAELYEPKKVNIMGGEPLLYRHLEKALEIFERVTVQTNGTLAKEKLRLLKRAEAVIISIEGRKRVNDAIRGRGVYGKVLEAVRALKNNGTKVLLRSTFSVWRMAEVPYLIRLSRRLGVPLYFYPELGGQVPTREHLLWLFQTVGAAEGEVWVDLPNFFAYMGQERSFCAAAESRWAFFPDGTIGVCQWGRDFQLGRIGDDPSLVWENADAFARTKIPPHECSGCPHEKTCRGGCLMVPYFRSCPLAHFAIEKIPEVVRREYQKTEKIRVLLRGVVTC